MECHYTIREGELVLNNSRKNKMIAYSMLFIRFFELLMLIFTFGATMYLTYVIFRKCITKATLAACIPLGSIFATFGSAIISVLSLYCNKQISLFQENLSALHEQIPEMSSWKRWPFLKRYDREIINLRKHNYYTLKNPQITFKSESLSLSIALPTCTADFYDLPIFMGIVKMNCFYKYFSQTVLRLNNTKPPKDLFIFHCTLMIYRNIIRYKTGTFFMWIGSEFVLASIIFSFFYPSISGLIL